jgi:hypothetical protein
VQPNRAAVDRHDVETYFRFGREELKIIFRHRTDSSAFTRIDSTERVAVRARRTRLDLNENERVTLACHDVDFAIRRAQVFTLDAKAQS